MRKFKILKWPTGVGIKQKNENAAYPLLKELIVDGRPDSYCLDVEGIRLYFYPNEVKEVTNE